MAVSIVKPCRWSARWVQPSTIPNDWRTMLITLAVAFGGLAAVVASIGVGVIRLLNSSGGVSE